VFNQLISWMKLPAVPPKVMMRCRSISSIERG